MRSPQIEAAYEHMDHNWAEITQSALVGCAFCTAQFTPRDVKQVYGWDEGAAFDRPLPEAQADDTARCPKCELPYVIGDASGLPVADKAFLGALYQYWFNSPAGAAK